MRDCVASVVANMSAPAVSVAIDHHIWPFQAKMHRPPQLCLCCMTLHKAGGQFLQSQCKFPGQPGDSRNVPAGLVCALLQLVLRAGLQGGGLAVQDVSPLLHLGPPGAA